MLFYLKKKQLNNYLFHNSLNKYKTSIFFKKFNLKNSSVLYKFLNKNSSVVSYYQLTKLSNYSYNFIYKYNSIFNNSTKNSKVDLLFFENNNWLNFCINSSSFKLTNSLIYGDFFRDVYLFFLYVNGFRNFNKLVNKFTPDVFKIKNKYRTLINYNRQSLRFRHTGRFLTTSNLVTRSQSFKFLIASRTCYLILNKYLFNLILFYKKSLKIQNYIYLLSNYDELMKNFFRLMRSTKSLNFYDFFFNFKKNIYKSTYIFNTCSISGKFNLLSKNSTLTQTYNFLFKFVKPSNFLTCDRSFYTYSPNLNSLNSIYKTQKIGFFNTLQICPKFHLNAIYRLSTLSLSTYLLLKPLFLKFSIWGFTQVNSNLDKFAFFPNLSKFVNNRYFFYNSNSTALSTNLIPDKTLQFYIKKAIIRVFDFDKYSSLSTPWHYHTLVKFLEYCSGKKVSINFNGFLNNSLSIDERIRCFLWSQRVKYFRKVLGPKLFLNESIQIIYLALKNKDPYLLSNWMVTTMYKISFWKYKTFLRYIKYVLRYYIWVIFKELKVSGIKFQLKGKISVAGNARTRTAYHYVGFTGHSTFNNKILYKLSLVRSFTGVMGLKLWIVF